MSKKKPFSKDVILLDNVAMDVESISKGIKEGIFQKLGRSGAVVGISGGIDSSVCLALTVKAVGAKNVLGIIMPEKDSSPESQELAQELALKFNVDVVIENLTEALNGFKCYERRDAAVKRVFPEYNELTYKMKIGIGQRGLYRNLPPIFSLTIIDEGGNKKEKILSVQDYLEIVASSNFKQRSRMAMLYFHAEANHYAVIGTPNKHEHEQGFFVKNGDGGCDLMPISHLYKTQVYQLAEFLKVPDRIIQRTPTSDTYSAEQTQEEFFFQLPSRQMDLFWFAFTNSYDPQEVADVMGRTLDEVKSVYANLERKIKTTEYLRMLPIKFQ